MRESSFSLEISIANTGYNLKMRFQQLSTQQSDFAAKWMHIQRYRLQDKKQQVRKVASILNQVRQEGDEALLSLSEKLDNMDRTQVGRIQDLVYDRDDFAAAAQRIPKDMTTALEEAALQITDYHTRQRIPTAVTAGPITETIIPLSRVGIYVPGGRAAYPSSLLMAAIPAHIGGVGELVVFSPAPSGRPQDIILACAQQSPIIKALYCIGGAQAIAAMAYGTESISSVDKIVGPGNSYVTEAKKQVYGEVGIDMLAGPSEVAIVADENAPIDWVAADLCAQAEHDPYAAVFLFSPYQEVLDRVCVEFMRCAEKQPRRLIIQQALRNRSAFIKTRDMEEALTIVNELAPEHTQLMTEEAQEHHKLLTRPPAVFCGYYSPVVFGDYCVGTNHILPTSPGGAFSSPLGVYDFVKRVSLVHLTKQQAAGLAKTAEQLAEAEGLFAHAYSAKLRA